MQSLRDERAIAARRGEITTRVDAIAPGIARVRRFRGNVPPASSLSRYGFIREQGLDEGMQISLDREGLVVRTQLFSAAISPEAGALVVNDANGRGLLTECVSSVEERDPLSALRFDLPPDLAFYGLGDQTRERIEHRGTRGDLWVRNVKSYIPIPLLLTSDGVGLLINTTRRVRYDLGASSDQWFGFEMDAGALDYYVLYGPTPREILGRYTDLTGRPPLLPKWALGLWFICRTQADAREFMEDCYAFRREHIPCDAIGLEPGWMSEFYDFSVEKRWHPERFLIPPYNQAHNFPSAAKRMGFKMGLWLCCDYDLSYEEERSLLREASGDAQGVGFAEGDKERDERLKGVRRLDPWTRLDEPWYDHLCKFVDQGILWFKQDGANQVLEHPDRVWGNGMLDDEMHNLNPLLYAKQMYRGFAEHTGNRPLVFTVAGWVGLQRYATTWTGDTGGGPAPLGACLNLSLSGHGMSTCDMEVTTAEGLHFGFLMPIAQINSWNYWRHPWFQGQRLQAIATDYARLRYRLLPYLYAAFWEAHLTGVPVMRAMPLDFPEDPEARHLLRQYMLGDALLVGAYTDRVYLPKGEWFNFWTEERLAGPGWVEPAIPEDRGGPLLVRAGSIIAMGPEIEYVGQRPEDEYTVHVYAGGDGVATLYEDDGLSLAFAEGAVCRTRIETHWEPGHLRVSILAAEGDLQDLPESREWTVVVHGTEEPSHVETGQGPVPSTAWDGERALLKCSLGRVPARSRIDLGIIF